MKILFITTSKNPKSGGAVITNRNFSVLRSIVGDENIKFYEIKRSINQTLIGKVKALISEIINLNFNGLTKMNILEIKNIIRYESVDCVFLDSSNLGLLAKKIKTENKAITIMTYFHNIEMLLAKDSVRVNFNIFLLHRIIIAYINEKKSCFYSDEVITINKRDSEKLYEIYNKRTSDIIPVCIVDQFKENDVNTQNVQSKIGLFVGSNFFPNIEAIKWFVKNVLPYVDMKFIVVGADLGLLKNNLSCENLEIFSDVEDLNYFYSIADFSILPILSGSGMKIKTAEALMHGKYIFGTKEAFSGYEVNNQIAKVCNNANEFIFSINKYKSESKFNNESRNLFLSKYSLDACVGKFQILLNK